MIRPLCLALAILATGCPLLDVEAELGEVCLTYRDVEVPGVATGDVARSFVFDDLAEVHQLLALDPELRFVRAEVRAVTGAESFAVDRATITIGSADPDAALPALPVYACDGDCPSDDGTLVIPAAAQTSALAYVAADAIAVDVALAGTLPAQPWRMDVAVCVEGSVAYRVEP